MRGSAAERARRLDPGVIKAQSRVAVRSDVVGDEFDAALDDLLGGGKLPELRLARLAKARGPPRLSPAPRDEAWPRVALSSPAMAHDTLRRCSMCDATLPGGTRFCGICGHDADDVAANLAFLATERAVQEPTQTELQAPAPTPRDRSSSPPLPPMRLLPGTMLSVYRIESVLGEGGMGVVYRAHDEARGRTVALKCLHTNLSGDAEIRRRFAREAKVLRSQSHPNIVAVYDFIEHEYLLAIVMEIVEGMSLVQHVAKWRGRMPFAEILVVFRGVLEAVAEGHRHGVIHRDLKPDNILVSGSGGEALRPKVVDFGIAKILEGTMYTMTGAMLGTCSYMSPSRSSARTRPIRAPTCTRSGSRSIRSSPAVCPFKAATTLRS